MQPKICCFAELALIIIIIIVVVVVDVVVIVVIISLPATSPEQGKASTATVSTLSNGATLVTEDAASSTTVTITYPGAGSGSEAAGEEGAALANQCMSFKSGSGISTILIYRNLEDEGATPFSSAGRFGATVGFTSAPEKATRLIPLLATQSTFEKWDVRDAKKLAAVQVEDAGKSAQVSHTKKYYKTKSIGF